MKFLLFALIHVMGQVVIAELNLPPKIFYNLNEAQNIYDKYLVTFNKNYDEEEYSSRFEIFKEKLKKINEFNKESNLTFYGINQFTDLKFEEVVNTYMGISRNINPTDLKEYKPVGIAPERLDYRENRWVTDVKSQGHCNSCYIFSAIGAIEGQHAKAHGQLISLSEQQVLDCESGNGCITGGWPVDVMKLLTEQGGAMPTINYPYTAKKGQCRTDKTKIVARVTGGQEFTVKNEEELKVALANHGPLSIALTVCEKFETYQGGIFAFEGNCEGRGLHAVLLVGYDSANGQEYWIIKNSWSTVWGEQGYMRMKLGIRLCDIGGTVTLATVA